MNKRQVRSGLILAGLLALVSGPVLADDEAEVAALTQRLSVLESDPVLAGEIAYETLNARNAVAAYAEARRSQREMARYIAGRRVEIAETAARTRAARLEMGRLERARNEMLVEAGQRETSRSRSEAERLRIQVQVQSEEIARLRQALEEERLLREESEATLERVSSREAAKLRAARQREAELARQEAELLKSLESGSDKPE